MNVNFDHIPKELRDRPQWVLWKTVRRRGDATKIPFQPNGGAASSTDPETWADFTIVAGRFRAGEYDGIGYVFSANDPYCGIDLDGCRNPETGEWAEWARAIIADLNSYTEMSPSRTGAKVFVHANSPFTSGKKQELDEPSVSEKSPGVEVYDQGRYFAVTGKRLSGTPPEIESRQNQLATLCGRLWETPARQVARVGATVVDRARSYMSKLESAVSGQGGHNRTFHVACVLVLGFGLSLDDSIVLMREYNDRCQPPWSERELLHKVEDAAKQPGERNYLRDAKPEHWDRVNVPNYAAKAPPPRQEVRVTTLEDAARKYITAVREGNTELIDTGLPDVDYAIGGGVALGEMVILAARPSHGKSAVALQCIHAATANDRSCLMISEEMSALALGKRSIQFASDISQEHWATSLDVLESQVESHFERRANCHVVEQCGSVDRAAEEIRNAVKEHGVEIVVIDYAQLLKSRGKSRYEEVTNTSAELRRVASELPIVLFVLCQLNRQIESRDSFMPKMSDIKDTGQLEQDADVILFLCWPHRLDSRQDANEYLVFVAKNRNRPINVSSVKCRFDPSRQMLEAEKPANYEHSFDEWNERMP